ncbi:hypothetical protein K438DRAFT_1982909 [Mycena galopus ATCC 62051]|nr:hypothetical protein K438DRAFT_1982909 [Mycena galopus ATCC 62051]
MAPLPDMSLLYGPILIGVFINLILYSVFLGQVHASLWERKEFKKLLTDHYIAGVDLLPAVPQVGSFIFFYPSDDDAWLRYFVRLPSIPPHRVRAPIPPCLSPIPLYDGSALGPLHPNTHAHTQFQFNLPIPTN